MSYYCPNCEQKVDDQICPDCGEVAKSVEEGETGAVEQERTEPLSPLLQESSETTYEERKTDERAASEGDSREARPEQTVDKKVAHVEPASQREATSPTSPRSSSGRAVIGEAAQRQLRHFVDEGYEIFLVAGIYQSGKTQLMDAFQSAGYLRALEDKKRGGRAIPTPPGRLNYFSVKGSGRKVVFIDAAGESFHQLYPYLRKGSEITEKDISFLKLLSDNLRGLVLLVDLQKLWHPELRSVEAENSQQEKILAWILELLRWLRLDGDYEPGALSFQEQVDSRVKTLAKRLDVPVLVLFSKADELPGLSVSGRDRTAWQKRAETRDGRKLYPLGEQPLLLARHRLPELYGAVRAHARNFRFDFVHSVVTDPNSGVILEDQPSCGVDYSLGWLLDPAWQRRFGRPLPSRFWIGLQERIDKLIGRGERWRRLPEPKEFP